MFVAERVYNTALLVWSVWITTA